ncbi:hypothetical protein [Sinorhizobium fredii]|uniref:hypothetical protein n=1 Tax=Rhizobium fredii TaxID=380 RepID=UPI0004B81932|nr:hypothetical protein [Sinorhizobium fredii]ASY69371.1 hypothetical protein SF83666_c19550 [Sinorhizobium fredii CCBAU 83666]
MSKRSSGLHSALFALRAIRLALHVSAVRADDRRAVEVYLLVTCCGVHQALAAEACSCTKQNVSKLVRAVEERRDDPAFDEILSAFEAAMTGE